MKARMLVLIFPLLFSIPAFADCADDVCVALRKILQERSSNFASVKGKPGWTRKGEQTWQGTQPIPGLIDDCYVYLLAGSQYEYRCEAPGLEAATWLPLDKAQEIVKAVKSALASADPRLSWFADPDSVRLSQVSGFEGSDGWYGGDVPNKLAVKVAIFGSGAAGTTASVIVFAKPLSRGDLK